MIESITPLITTYNEESNIARTLERLVWARRIVVIDSGSTDKTIEIVRSYPQAEVFHRNFDNCASQWNFGNEQVNSDWVLSLDADYQLSDDLIMELRDLNPSAAADGYLANFVYRIFGRPLRGSLYPPRVVLYRKVNAHYINQGHTQRLIVAGRIFPLSNVIFHDDRKPLARWFATQRRYAQNEVEHLLGMDHRKLRGVDRIRAAAWPAPLVIFIYTLVVKGTLLDGWPGWYYALQRLLFETMLALNLIDRRLRRHAERNCL